MAEEQPQQDKAPGISRRDLLKGLGLGLTGLVATEMGVPSKNVEAQEEVAETVPIFETGEVIDGLETFGSIDNPLNQEQFNQIRDRLNSQETEISNSVVSGTQIVDASTAQAIKNTFNESPSSFYKRHEVEMNRMLGEADLDIEFSLRRLIIMKQDMGPNQRLDFIDSDGVNSQMGQVYSYQSSYLYDDDIDSGVNHEGFHTYFGERDAYGLSYRYEEESSTNWMNLLPQDYRSYFPHTRNDLGGGVMSSAKNRQLGLYIESHLRKRQRENEIHEFQSGWHFPTDMPENISFNFQYNNSDIQIQKIDLYRSIPTEGTHSYAKHFSEEPTLTTQNASIMPESLFSDVTEEQGIPVAGGTVAMIITDINGDQFLRQMDIRDYNLAVWGDYGDNVQMEMNVVKLGAENPSPQDFDWTVGYSVAD